MNMYYGQHKDDSIYTLINHFIMSNEVKYINIILFIADLRFI